jgi:thiamine-monophosphate kinase
MTEHVGMGAGGEFDLVRRMLSIWGDLAEGVGSDTALLSIPSGLFPVVSTDTSVENVHFRRDWLSPRQIGYRAVASALSDLAAAGASPVAVLICLTIPESWLADLDDLAFGIGEAVQSSGDGKARVVGGDTSRGLDLSLAVTVIGAAVSPLSRRGARVGDRLVVTGDVGRSARALRALRGGETPDPADMKRFSHPVPRIREGIWFAERGARAAVDISDGLSSELAHLAAASAVHLHVDLDNVPVPHGLNPHAAMQSGEEYELLVALPPEVSIAEFRHEVGTAATEIGRVITGPPGVSLLRGGELIAPPPGHDHF